MNTWPSFACLLVLAGLLGAAPAAAQTPSEAEAATRLVLRETASRDVEQDTLEALVVVRAEAATAREAQAQVNAGMTEAIAVAQATDEVRPATSGYRVYEDRDKNGRRRAWVAEQDLRLTSEDPAAVLQLVDRLQEQALLLRGLDYQLSARARRALTDDLTVEALDRLRSRAGRVGEALGLAVARIETVRVGGVDEPPPVGPMRTMAMAESAGPPPVALPGLETVRVTVEAEVALTRP
jgi:predicted secreted protein